MILIDDTMYNLIESSENMLQIYIKFALLSRAMVYHETLNQNVPICHFLYIPQLFSFLQYIKPIALRKAKTLWSFGHSECNRVNLGRLVRL